MCMATFICVMVMHLKNVNSALYTQSSRLFSFSVKIAILILLWAVYTWPSKLAGINTDLAFANADFLSSPADVCI